MRNGERGFNAEKQSGGEAEKESSSESHNFSIVGCDNSNLPSAMQRGLGAKTTHYLTLMVKPRIARSEAPISTALPLMRLLPK